MDYGSHRDRVSAATIAAAGPGAVDGAAARDSLAHRWVRLPVGRVGRRTASWASMRAARAIDELRALGDFRVWLRPESFTTVMLTRVVDGFATAPHDAAIVARRPDVGTIERLDPADRAALERAYRELQGYEEVLA